MDITVHKGSITQLEVDAIVNPSNSLGYMGGGVAEVIKKVGGDIIEEEAVAQAPNHVGCAITTSAGTLKCKAVIHASTMENPAEKIPLDHIRAAIVAALDCAEYNGFSCIAMPGLGTGVGGIPKLDAAGEMITAIRQFENHELIDVILVDVDDDVVDAWRKALNNK
ncbi:macro domain-containing protein [Candidatus Woesearchaeota archaeon]|nr:macro domain-containing protein [Candidatus Woesearchaeota archaeon]